MNPLLAVIVMLAAPPGARKTTPPGPPPAASPLRPLALPGGSAGIGFDDLRFARSLGKLLVPAGRTGNLDLVDPATREITPIGGFRSQAAFAARDDFGVTSADEGEGYLFATDRTSLMLQVVDPAAGKIVGGAKLAGSPDYVRYVAPTKELWVTEPDKQRIEIFRLEKREKGGPPTPVHDAFLIVPGGPESLVIDTMRGRAYTHHWAGITVALDLRARAQVAKWPNGCKDSRGISLDEPRGYLFAGCAEGKAEVLDVKNGYPLGEIQAGDGVDIIDYDPGLSHLYVPGARSQSLTVAGVSALGKLEKLGTFPTAPGTHCVAADGRGDVYVCDPRRGRLLVLRDPYPASKK